MSKSNDKKLEAIAKKLKKLGIGGLARLHIMPVFAQVMNDKDTEAKQEREKLIEKAINLVNDHKPDNEDCANAIGSVAKPNAVEDLVGQWRAHSDVVIKELKQFIKK